MIKNWLSILDKVVRIRYESTRRTSKLKNSVEDMAEQGQKGKKLVVFDFDHTLIEDNSDVFVQHLGLDGKIPESIKSTYRSKNWIEFMNNVFKYLHGIGISGQQILDCMDKMVWTSGMIELIKYLHDQQNNEMIVISDSNTIFINRILQVAGMSQCIRKVFTNAAEFDEKGLLCLSPYHQQDWCELSTENMCKGYILDCYLNERLEKDGVKFEQIIYVGDGANDLCPAIRLSKSDLVFARSGFGLMKLIDKNKQANGIDLRVIAKVIPWNSGNEIVDYLTLQSQTAEV
ncbi:Phospho-2-dehydro-3-deoxyheptonate aldolase AroG [Chamberlinius hualienensis]